jgi:hypothetical protein
MAEVKVTISKCVDMSQPIFVEFEFADCNGIKHIFVDKLPIVSASSDIELPCDGVLRCTIVSENDRTYIIDTSTPFDVESNSGESRFEVFKDQVVL